MMVSKLVNAKSCYFGLGNVVLSDPARQRSAALRTVVRATYADCPQNLPLGAPVPLWQQLGNHVPEQLRLICQRLNVIGGQLCRNASNLKRWPAVVSCSAQIVWSYPGSGSSLFVSRKQNHGRPTYRFHSPGLGQRRTRLLLHHFQCPCFYHATTWSGFVTTLRSHTLRGAVGASRVGAAEGLRDE